MSKKVGYPSQDRNHEDFYGPEVMNQGMPENMTVYDYIYESNKNRLNLPAINYFDNKIKYRDFLDNSNKVAISLINYGVKQGDCITAIVPNLPESFYILLGASRIGATVSFVDPRYGEKAIEEKIKSTNSKLVIAFDGNVKTYNRRTKQFNVTHVLDKVGNIIKSTDVEVVIALPASNSITLKSIFKNDTIRAALFNQAKSNFKEVESWKEFFKSSAYSSGITFAQFEENRPVAIVSTGGSTGIPKSAVFSNENIIKATFQCQSTGIFPEEARWYDIMPPSIAYGLADGSILPFSLGNEVRLNPDPTAESLKTKGQLQMVEDFVRFDPHTIACAPNHVFAIINSKEWKNTPHSLVNFIVGGDSLNQMQIKRADEQLKLVKRPKNFEKEKLLGTRPDILTINTGYGATEVTAAASVAPGSENVKENTVGLTLPYEVVSTFKKNMTTGKYEELPYVKEEDIENVNSEQIGEVCVEGPNVMLGYLNNEEENNKTFIIHEDGKRWAHLGDLGFIDEEGYVHYIDREKYVSVGHDGFKVAPIEIERVLLKENKIDACKAVIFDDIETGRGSLIKVYYTLKEKEIPCDISKLEDKLNLMCADELADYKCPIDYECLDKLPITPSGKIDVISLKEDAEKKTKQKILTKNNE